jgi:chromosome partitioning protein
MTGTPAPKLNFIGRILDHSGEISTTLDMLRTQRFPPNAQKTLREFGLTEAATILGVSGSYLKKLERDKGVKPTTVTPAGRRSYSLEKIHELREITNRVPHRKHHEKLQVLAAVNFKGGSGKTTTAAHLAQYLALKGHRVLVIDLDPQASLTSMYGIQPELDNKPSLYEALRFDDQRCSIKDVIQPTNFPNLDIVPANLELQEYEYETPLAMHGPNSKEGKLFWTRIITALNEIDSRYDIVVIDCPPQLGYLTLTALTAATAALITIHPQMMDVMSMAQFLAMLGGILGPLEKVGVPLRLEWFRYLITRYEPTDIPQQQMVGLMQAMFTEDMLKHQMVKSTAVSDAGLTKQTLYEVERGQFTPQTYDRAREALDAVNEEVLQLINKAWGR